MELTHNERRILKFLIENGRVMDTEVAEKLNITSQAVGKTRRKLEREGIIKGYSTIIDHEKIGIKVFAIALFKFIPEVWKTLKDRDINERIRGSNIINFYRIPEGDVTHIVVYGFRSLDELDHYFHVLQTERGHISEIRKLYIFSAKSFKKDSSKDLYLKVLKEWRYEQLPRPIKADVKQ
ncbi:MAG: hypothetical protein A7315_10370 [Candidatus Altiarchaeales archaeon WOR_SM1_79]|nr:MAG: hypothetical protein A7315_10370 [Candidatus Altiarchaeales archaeon WOR_SM1_79]